MSKLHAVCIKTKNNHIHITINTEIEELRRKIIKTNMKGKDTYKIFLLFDK